MIPERSNKKKLLLLILFKTLKKNGLKKIAALEILNAPISKGVKVTNDFFIRIGELPQMMLNKINKNQG